MLFRSHKGREAIIALRQAIAEAEKQEPIYAHPDPDALNAAYIMGVQDGKKMREPMTDEQIQEVVGADANFWATSKLWIISIVRAIEAAHGIKEKNT